MRADRECGTSWSGCGLVKRSLRCRFGGIEPHITSWFQSHSRDQVFASPCRNHRENRMAASQGVKALGRRELFSWRTLSIISLLEENPTHRSTDTTYRCCPSHPSRTSSPGPWFPFADRSDRRAWAGPFRTSPKFRSRRPTFYAVKVEWGWERGSGYKVIGGRAQ